MRFAAFALSTLVANAAAGVIAPRGDVDYSGVDWTKVDYSGVDWTKVDYTGGNKDKDNKQKQPEPVQKVAESSVAPAPTSVSVPTTVPAVVAAAAPTTTLVTKVATSAAAVATQTSTPSQPSTGNLSDDQQKALDAHNAARAAVGNSPLTWDDSLSSDAQSWANTIATLASLTHSSGSGQGENLYMQSDNGSPFLNAINSFLSEKSLYSGQVIDGSNFGAFGHYTQAVWKSTTKVGMAVAKAADGTNWVVVRYSPPGNFIGQTPY
ncbi:unnamed protein product [Clonostachys rosea f. rosea IK726]|uniref:SCP domain-containing protein n=2 Tax=Bionectria ochroleuca TaxID=29856 RepID=A0A0B7K8B3_BIOOC|nr:unnamed protein product [Clonostachys rosea f. rosea IK726]